MANGAPIQAISIFSSETIAASGNVTFTLDLERHNVEGFFSIQLAVTGSGTIKGEYLLSNDGANYIEPSTATDIFSTFGSGSGPGTDGKDIFSFEPELAKYLRIKITEDGGANSATVTAHLCMQ